MKYIKTIVFLVSVYFALPAQAQLQKSAASALLKSGTKQTAQQTIRISAEQLVGLHVIPEIKPAFTGQKSAPFSVTANKLPVIDRNILQGKISSAQQQETEVLIQQAVEVWERLDRFIYQQHQKFPDEPVRFPENRFGEDTAGLSEQQIQELATESNLRQQIDEIVSIIPDHPIAKEFIALYNDLAEDSLDKAVHVFKEISPFNLFTLPKELPVSFAKPISLASEELPNAYQLTKHFYRGGQPTEQGYKMLADRGVKTIISFRTHKPNKQLIENLGMESVHIPLNPALITSAQITRFLQIVSDPAHQPVYVHCRHGSDRTGTMVAMYRMVFQKWSRDQALNEMKNPLFGYHKIFFTLPSHIKMVNTTKLSGKLKK